MGQKNWTYLKIGNLATASCRNACCITVCQKFQNVT